MFVTCDIIQIILMRIGTRVRNSYREKVGFSYVIIFHMTKLLKNNIISQKKYVCIFNCINKIAGLLNNCSYLVFVTSRETYSTQKDRNQLKKKKLYCFSLVPPRHPLYLLLLFFSFFLSSVVFSISLAVRDFTLF